LNETYSTVHSITNSD